MGDKLNMIVVGAAFYRKECIDNLNVAGEQIAYWELDGLEPEGFHTARWNIYADFFLSENAPL